MICTSEACRLEDNIRQKWICPAGNTPKRDDQFNL